MPGSGSVSASNGLYGHLRIDVGVQSPAGIPVYRTNAYRHPPRPLRPSLKRRPPSELNLDRVERGLCRRLAPSSVCEIIAMLSSMCRHAFSVFSGGRFAIGSQDHPVASRRRAGIPHGPRKQHRIIRVLESGNRSRHESRLPLEKGRSGNFVEQHNRPL